MKLPVQLSATRIVLASVAFWCIEHFLHGLGDAVKYRLKEAAENVLMRPLDNLPKKHAVFDLDYHDLYPEVKELEENWEIIREELEDLLHSSKTIPEFTQLRNGTMFEPVPVKWQSFFLKLGSFVDGNMQHAPRTAEMLQRIPSLYTALFSIIHPHQYLVPHWGTYKGLIRYQLGIKIPHNNVDNSSYIRINPNIPMTAEYKRLILEERNSSFTEQGQVYYWKNGQGVMFDDTFLHDAANESDELRVVLFLDLVRKEFPWYVDWFNKMCLYVAMRDSWLHEVRQEATLT